MIKRVGWNFWIGILGGFMVVAMGLPQGAVYAQTTVKAQLARLEAELVQLKKANAQDRGRLIYRVACADCHGVDGDGKGTKASGFAQHATSFTSGVYKFRGTTAELPAPGDLERSIREGMPGTEMVPFKGLLDDPSIKALAAYLKTFSPKFDSPKAVSTSANATRGKITIPAKRPFPRSEASIAKGKAVYGDLDCADCHGDNGSGNDDEEDDAGFPVVMMDFRDGVYKSGTTDADLYRTTATGMQGTTMEAYSGEAKPNDLWALVDYMRSLEEAPGLIGWLFQQPSRYDYRDF